MAPAKAALHAVPFAECSLESVPDAEYFRCMAQLLIENGTEAPVVYELNGEVVRIGRSPENDIVLDDASVSAHHAELVPMENVWLVRDLDSSNGTTRNGHLIQSCALQHGDSLGIAGISCIFHVAHEVLNDRLATIEESREYTSTVRRPAFEEFFQSKRPLIILAALAVAVVSAGVFAEVHAVKLSQGKLIASDPNSRTPNNNLKTSANGIGVSIELVQELSRCRFVTAPPAHGPGALLAVNDSQRFIMVAKGNPQNLSSIKLSAVVSPEDQSISKEAISLFQLVLSLVCPTEASEWGIEKFKSALFGLSDDQPPGRQFGHLHLQTSSIKGVGTNGGLEGFRQDTHATAFSLEVKYSD